ncbi:MAG: EamA family transporter [Planctomycetia bacterium]|nr:EamA family transporter [Planctomycetia bacterium]
MEPAIFYAILAALFAALTAILAKIGITGVDSDLAVAIRTLVVVIFAWGIVAFRGVWHHIPSLSTKTILFLILSGLATGASWLFYFKAIQMGNVSQVAPIDKLSIALTIILAFIILGESPDAKTLIGGGLVTAGVMVIALWDVFFKNL